MGFFFWSLFSGNVCLQLHVGLLFFFFYMRGLLRTCVDHTQAG